MKTVLKCFLFAWLSSESRLLIRTSSGGVLKLSTPKIEESFHPQEMEIPRVIIRTRARGTKYQKRSRIEVGIRYFIGLLRYNGHIFL